MIKQFEKILFLFFAVALLVACRNEFTPKPRGYFKVVLPEHSYQTYNADYCPFTFEYPTYAKLVRDTTYFDTVPESPCWMTMKFTELNADLFLSYKEINEKHDLDKLIEDTHVLTYKHTVKANFIDEQEFSTPNNVSGLFFNVGGNAASNIQFFLTDSTHHFIRGSLYFNNVPNVDSLAPVIKFVRKDINHMIGSLKWK